MSASTLLKCINCGSLFDPKDESPFKDFNCSYHPREPFSIGNTGPRFDYAELWSYRCCGKRTIGKISPEGSDIFPGRVPGCVNGFHTAYNAKVFVSYSRMDNNFATFLESELQRRGYFLWRDVTEITAGQNWEAMINNAIEICSHFVIILSQNSVASKEVRRELDIALNVNTPIIPILISGCDIPVELSRINYIDWKESIDHANQPGFEKLREAFLLNQKQRE